MELWDILDKDGNLTGKTVERGKPRSNSEYHLVVMAWLVDKDKNILISKRAPEKMFGGKWEITGGAAVSGEDSKTAVLREIEEELGLTIKNNDCVFYKRYKRDFKDFPDFIDMYVCFHDFGPEDVTFQEGETCDAKTVSFEGVKEMLGSGELLIWGNSGYGLDELEQLIDFVRSYQ